MGHYSGVKIERSASIIHQELKVAYQVDDKEKYKENAGKAHNHLLTKGRGEKTGYPGHN